MNAYATAGWENFFVAEAGAAAALAGLVFVAASINLARILSISGLPGRAGETVQMLLGVLLVATVGLVPGQPRRLLAVEIGGTGLLLLALATRIQWPQWQRDSSPHRRWLLLRTVMTVAATLPFIVGGASLYCARGGGLYWLVPGVLLSFFVGALNAWVLLVEINR